NETVSPGDVIGRIEVIDEGEVQLQAPSVSITKAPTAFAGEQKLSPAVRQLVKRHNIELSNIIGTGRDGRITAQDVQNYLRRVETRSGLSLPGGKMVPHSPLRRRIAQHIVESTKTAPHVTAVFDADLTAVDTHRHED